MTREERRALAGELVHVRGFLDGSQTYESTWFGERHRMHQGAFWWRSVLLPKLDEAAAALRASHPAGETGERAPCPCGDGPGHGDAWCGDYECPTCRRGPVDGTPPAAPTEPPAPVDKFVPPVDYPPDYVLPGGWHKPAPVDAEALREFDADMQGIMDEVTGMLAALNTDYVGHEAVLRVNAASRRWRRHLADLAALRAENERLTKGLRATAYATHRAPNNQFREWAQARAREVLTGDASTTTEGGAA